MKYNPNLIKKTSDEPVFIGGLSFSGKTQLGGMLSCHPNIVILRKTYSRDCIGGRYQDLSQPKNIERCIETMLKSKHLRMLAPDKNRIQRDFLNGPLTYPRLLGLFHEQYAEDMGKTRWGIQHSSVVFHADQLFSACPSAKIIHMIRDPRERYRVCLSHSKNFLGKAGWETAQWRKSANLAVQNSRRYPDRYQVVLYEDFLSYPEETLRRVCLFLEEEFHPQMLLLESKLEFRQWVLENEEGDLENNSSLNAEPPKTRSPKIPKHDLAFIQSAVDREMSFFGYALKQNSSSMRDWLVFLTTSWPANMVGALYSRISHVS